jgi:hypothetical protein
MKLVGIPFRNIIVLYVDTSYSYVFEFCVVSAVQVLLECCTGIAGVLVGCYVTCTSFLKLSYILD